MIVLVPAYEPDHRLPGLVADLVRTDPTLRVVVVDDGSGPSYEAVFAAVEALGATVLRHGSNRGKGAALRTGFGYVRDAWPGHDVVCADCDGQHAPEDVLRVAGTLRERTGAIVLGARAFTGPVPLRSRLGNDVTRAAFALATGRRLADTQTGLRGYPAALLPWLGTVPGDRFEYELRVLLAAVRAGIPVDEVPIETIYLAGNASSHFRPLADSVRVYAPLLRFAASGLLALAVDTLAVLLLVALTGSLVAAVLGARAISSAVNFAVNRRLVFPRGAEVPVRAAAARYYALAGALLVANLALMTALTRWGVPVLAAKAGTEAALVATSYLVQRRVVFVPPPAPVGTPVPVTLLTGGRVARP